ncbi:MAG: hypothetical protein GF320_12190, partial [Armatimonadia bacterium]|nr:hypothetical protein [Armatimonadia bacterium]
MSREQPYATPEPGVRRWSPWWRTLLHSVVGLAGWAIIAYAWHRFADGIVAYNLIRDVTLGLALVALAAVVTVYWIAHNLRIVRVRGEQRRTPRRVAADYSTDYLGRRLTGPLEACRRASYVEVATSWDEKRYRPGPITDLGVA